MKELLSQIEDALDRLYEMAFLDKHKNCPEYVREKAVIADATLTKLKQLECQCKH